MSVLEASDAERFAAELPPGPGILGPGVFLAVAGPSGAGKDSIIDSVRGKYAGDERTGFVTRVITRPEGSQGEAHDSVTLSDFADMERRGAFALSWHAHGLAYGIPAVADTWIGEGRVVIANLSRAMLGEAMRRYRRLVAVHVTADPDVLAKRLGDRGREAAGDIQQRLLRLASLDVPDGNVFGIDNSGALSAASERFEGLLRACLKQAAK